MEWGATDDLRAECDFSAMKARPNPFAARMQAPVVTVVLEPAGAFGRPASRSDSAAHVAVVDQDDRLYDSWVKFEWDRKKSAENLAKHGVSFEDDESRFITVGHSAAGHLVVVVHAERGDRLRIISARLATPAERRRYESQVRDQKR